MTTAIAVSKRILLFANPTAGRGRSLTVARRLTAVLNEAGYTVEQPAGEPATAEWAPQPVPRAALVIGGDGTLRSAVERLLAAGPCPPVLPIPMGTANLMGRHLGLRWTPHTLVPAVLDVLSKGVVTRLDAGRANGRLFLLMVGVGLDAEVVRLLHLVRRGPIDLTSYVLPTIRAFATYRFPRVSVWIDGELAFNDTPALVQIGNVKEYGTGIPILVNARSDDGLLDVCVMPCRNPLQLAELLLALVAGEHTGREGVMYRQCREVRVESAAPVPVQFDGDVAGSTPLDVQVLPAWVPLLVRPELGAQKTP